MRERTLPALAPRRTTLSLLAASAVLVVGLLAAVLTRFGTPSFRASYLGVAANPQARPVVLLPISTADDPQLAAVRTTGLVLVDARSGVELDRYAIPDSTVVMSAFFLPPGDRVVFYAGDRSAPHAELQVRRLPGWEVESVAPVHADIPPIRALAGRFPSVANDDSTLLAFAPEPGGRWAAVAFWSQTTRNADGTLGQLVWVTALELERGTWADWAYPLPTSQVASLVSLPDRILVFGDELRTSTRRSVGTIVALRPSSGRPLGQLTLESESTSAKPLGEGPGDEHATFSGALPPILWNDQLLVVNWDLEAFVIDPATLTPSLHRPPLTERLVAAGTPLVAGDRLVVGGSAVRVIDPATWRIVATYPMPERPEAWWLSVGVVDPDTLLLIETREGCLRHLDLVTGQLSAPLACGFAVDYPAPSFGWPAFGLTRSG